MKEDAALQRSAACTVLMSGRFGFQNRWQLATSTLVSKRVCAISAEMNLFHCFIKVRFARVHWIKVVCLGSRNEFPPSIRRHTVGASMGWGFRFGLLSELLIGSHLPPPAADLLTPGGGTGSTRVRTAVSASLRGLRDQRPGSWTRDLRV